MILNYYQNNAKVADLRSEPFQQVVLREWLRSLNIKDKVLDFGTGAGANLETLKKAGFSKIFACDISKLAVGLVKQKYPTVKTVLLKNTLLPFNDQLFSLIVATEVLEHIPSFTKTLGEFDRVLKKRGYLLISTPNYLNFTGIIKTFMDLKNKRKDWNPWQAHKGGVERLTTPFSFFNHLKNFKKVRSSGLDFYLAWFYLLPKQFLKFREKMIFFPGNLPIFKHFCMHYCLLLKKR